MILKDITTVIWIVMILVMRHHAVMFVMLKIAEFVGMKQSNSTFIILTIKERLFLIK